MIPASVLARGLIGRRDLYPGALIALDFKRRFYKARGLLAGNPANLPGWTFNRASVGTAEESSGNVVLFAAGVPRITDKGLLVEESRTNAWPTSYAGTPISIWPTVSSASLSVGVLNPRLAGATSVLITTTGANGRAQRNMTVPVDTVTRTFSVDVQKKALSYNVSIGYSGGTPIQSQLVFDGATGAISSGTGTVVSKNADWWRVSVSLANNATPGSTLLFGFVQLTGAAGLTAEVALPQAEEGAFATSWIPTTGAPATRAAEAPLVSAITLPSGEFDIDMTWSNAATPAATVRTLEFHDGSDSNRIIVQQVSTGVVVANLNNGGATTQIGGNSSALTGARDISATLKRRGGDWQFWVNGAQVGVPLTAAVPPVTTMGLAYRRTSAEYLNGVLRAVTVIRR